MMAVDEQLPDTWPHEASGSDAEDGLVFEYFWLPIAEARRVSASRFHPSIDFALADTNTGSAP
jgi:hypothetical protein